MAAPGAVSRRATARGRHRPTSESAAAAAAQASGSSSVIGSNGQLVVTCCVCGLTHEIDLMRATVTENTPAVLGWERHPDGGWSCGVVECSPWLADAAS